MHAHLNFLVCNFTMSWISSQAFPKNLGWECQNSSFMEHLLPDAPANWIEKGCFVLLCSAYTESISNNEI